MATKNPAKFKEFSDMATSEPWLDLLLAPQTLVVEESGSTFVENAQIKAKAAALASGLLAVADDSGIIVEALNGKPGIYSSRYCPGTDADRRQKLLEDLSLVPSEHRQAAFICAMAVCEADGRVLFSTIACWEGYIGFREKGSNGFGYDSLFYLNLQDKTAAELSVAEKNQISHRGQAWRQVITFLKTYTLT